ncbi:universal stress protein [Isoptericola halotolerans]|uniref:Nucleotide-binding universal stress UspA family protein n=1 Tax=Isoptericola halotolerans TaxID=300560 RepID=A0ABX2A229_9MICO|nr:universal stress protein [Isoptericola halotolerans]NOV95988.1 nucleotide-binding universal stress UspA family protein [Isoptericola halotolerans]
MEGIVVGVNGTTEADEALDWAVAEASSGGHPLTIVRVAPAVDEADLTGVLEEVRAETAAILDRARERHDRFDAEYAVLPGPVPEALLAASATAQMLVLGRRRRARIGRRILGSVSAAVVEHARVPVTVVRRTDDRGEPAAGGSHAPAPPPSGTPRVVVGVDTSAPSVTALRHAAEVADRTGAVLEAVFAWQITTLAPLPGSWGWAPPISDYEHFARECLDAAVTAAGVDLAPDRLRRHVVHGQAAKVLIEASVGADRLVVGARGLGGFDRLLLGSTSRQVLDFAGCPVTVLHA